MKSVKRSAFVTRSDDGYFEAGTMRPEMRAEREALSLIHFLRDQGQPQSAWLNAITAERTHPPTRFAIHLRLEIKNWEHSVGYGRSQTAGRVFDISP